MKYTVLRMVQGILSAMDSDEVNSIGDTIEAQQVALCIENVYNDVTSNMEFPEDYVLLQLDPSGDPDLPTLMFVPENIENIEWVKYNKVGGSTSVGSSQAWTTPDGLTIHYGQSEALHTSSGGAGGANERFEAIKFLQRPEFLKLTQSFDSNATNVKSYRLPEGPTTIPMLCRNDKHPEFYTVFSGNQLVFDSFDVNLDSTLQSYKTLAYGKKARRFIMQDDWVINLDDKYTSLLYNEAKALCFAELKQTVHNKAEKTARRAWIHSQKAKQSVPYGDPAQNYLPNYGRKR